MKIGLLQEQWKTIKKATGKTNKEMYQEYYRIKKRIQIPLGWRIKQWIMRNLPKR